LAGLHFGASASSAFYELELGDEISSLLRIGTLKRWLTAPGDTSIYAQRLGPLISRLYDLRNHKDIDHLWIRPLDYALSGVAPGLALKQFTSLVSLERLQRRLIGDVPFYMGIPPIICTAHVRVPFQQHESIIQGAYFPDGTIPGSSISRPTNGGGIAIGMFIGSSRDSTAVSNLNYLFGAMADADAGSEYSSVGAMPPKVFLAFSRSMPTSVARMMSSAASYDESHGFILVPDHPDVFMVQVAGTGAMYSDAYASSGQTRVLFDHMPPLVQSMSYAILQIVVAQRNGEEYVKVSPTGFAFTPITPISVARRFRALASSTRKGTPDYTYFRIVSKVVTHFVDIILHHSLFVTSGDKVLEWDKVKEMTTGRAVCDYVMMLHE
jgi:hypothetical protein